MNGKYKLFIALAVVFVTGLALGRLSAPNESAKPVDTARLAALPEPPPAAPEVPTPAERLSAAERLSVAEAALDRSLANAGLGDMRASLEEYGFDWRGQFEPAVDFVIDQMSDKELITAITGVTNLSEAEVSSMRDLREFASRLSSVAFKGVFSEPEPRPPEVDAISFSTEVTAENAAEQAGENFEAGDGRIYAVFPSDRLHRDEVLAKWYRSDRPELLMLETHKIDPQDGLSYVWFEPDSGWEPGEYGVEFYTTDSSVEPIATGQYTIR
jgi:hypothetical protein